MTTRRFGRARTCPLGIHLLALARGFQVAAFIRKGWRRPRPHGFQPRVRPRQQWFTTRLGRRR